jgi:Arc/MetJ-type ribon-helix-helix transcriptional regulator
MPKKSISARRSKSGPPVAVTNQLVATRMPPELIRSIDQWAAAHADGSRSEAMRRLLELGLKAAPRRGTHTSQRDAVQDAPAEPTSLWPMPGDVVAPELASQPKRRK